MYFVSPRERPSCQRDVKNKTLVLSVFSHIVKKGILGLTRLFFEALSDVTVVHEMRQSIVEHKLSHTHMLNYCNGLQSI